LNKQLIEVDCRGLRTRSLSFTSFDWNMATVKQRSYDSTTDPWGKGKAEMVGIGLVKTA
jgi:hypothetical protein